MADNASLGAAKNAKNDEFYTQYSDIEAEMNAYVEFDPDVFRGKTILLPCDDPEWSNFTKYFAANFERFGLKKLISTSYARGAGNRQLTLFESESPLFDEDKRQALHADARRGRLGQHRHRRHRVHGIPRGRWRLPSAEVRKLRDEADIIITNPPFSKFHDFIAWIQEGRKQFIIIGNMNAIKYREVFPCLKDDEIWLGPGFPGGNAYFRIAPEDARDFSNGVYDESAGLVKFRNVCWFTNIDHGKRHEPLLLDTMEHNLKFNKRLCRKFEKDFGTVEYPRYANYDALEVPFTECIPSDYDGVMGVPITFMDRYNPDQFELLGMSGDLDWARSECAFFTPPDDEVRRICKARSKTWRVQKVYVNDADGLPLLPIYDRLFIRLRKGA